ELALGWSACAAPVPDTKSLLRFFCETTREFFQASGSYFWQVVSPDELVGIEADGLMADEFGGTLLSLKTGHSAVALQSIRSTKTVYINNVDAERYSMEREYRARSIMAAPLIVCGEVIGATVFLHDSDPEFFSEDLAAKATILVGQAAVALEMKRNLHFSEQHRRRSEALMSLPLQSSGPTWHWPAYVHYPTMQTAPITTLIKAGSPPYDKFPPLWTMLAYSPA